MLAGSLRRLVLDFPYRAFYTDNGEFQLAITFGRAFRRHIAIEDFVSIADSLSFNVRQGEPDYRCVAWSTWPRLRRLSLRSPYIDEKFVEALLQCRRLTHLVVAEPKGLDSSLPGHLADRVSGAGLGLRRMTVVQYGVRPHLSLSTRLMVTFADGAPASTGRPAMRYVDIPFVLFDPIDRIEAWLREYSLDGTIWESHGHMYEPAT